MSKGKKTLTIRLASGRAENLVVLGKTLSQQALRIEERFKNVDTISVNEKSPGLYAFNVVETSQSKRGVGK